jgi:U3 small nucleolar RNA-associated protein 19
MPAPTSTVRVSIASPPLTDGDRSTIQSIKSLEEAARASVSDLNNLPKILQHASSGSAGEGCAGSPRVVVAALQALCRFLSSSMESGLLSPSSSSSSSSSSSTETVRVWLRQFHSTFCKTLLASLSSPLPFIQASALRCIIGLSAREAETCFDKDSLSGGLLPRCIALLLDNTQLADVTIQVLLQEYAQVYDDVRCHILNAITTGINEMVLNHTRPCNSSASVMDFAVTMLLAITPAAADASAASVCLVAPALGDKRENVKSGKKKAFGRAWLAVLRCDMSPQTYKKILKAVATHVVPHLNQPLLLADFFTRSYDVGGVVSILALNGLFFLIHKHNLDYPQFYMKLYRLFEPSVLHVRYVAAFPHYIFVTTCAGTEPVFSVWLTCS